MIVVCPGCGKRYRLADERLAHGRPALRCTACGEVFDAAAPEGAPPRPAIPGSATVTGAGTPSSPEAPLALVADLDPQSGALARRTLEELGCRVHSVNDGEQAFRFAVTRRPRLLILHLKLPKLSGLAVCEGVKSSPDLKETRVALFGPPGWLARAERMVPAARYADDRFEAGVSPLELRRRLALLLGTSSAPGTSARPAPPARPPAAAPAPPAPVIPPPRPQSQLRAPAPRGTRAPAPAKGAPSGPHAEIRRMARAILSDLKVYHPDLFRQAVETGRFLEVFKAELAQCKEVVAQRFPDLPDRLVLLSSALKEGIDEEKEQAV